MSPLVLPAPVLSVTVNSLLSVLQLFWALRPHTELPQRQDTVQLRSPSCLPFGEGRGTGTWCEYHLSWPLGEATPLPLSSCPLGSQGPASTSVDCVCFCTVNTQYWRASVTFLDKEKAQPGTLPAPTPKPSTQLWHSPDFLSRQTCVPGCLLTLLSQARQTPLPPGLGPNTDAIARCILKAAGLMWLLPPLPSQSTGWQGDRAHHRRQQPAHLMDGSGEGSEQM